MKTYYIEFERQGYTLCVVKVEAETYEQAKLKAFEAWHANDDIGEISEEDAKSRLENGDIDYIIDEDGIEIDLEDEDDDYSPGYIIRCIKKDNGRELISEPYQTPEVATAIATGYWEDGEGEYSEVTIHEIARGSQEALSDANCIWRSKK